LLLPLFERSKLLYNINIFEFQEFKTVFKS
jgi:hypothetical protein